MTVVYTAYSMPDALFLDSLLRASDIDSQLLDLHHSTLQSHMILAIGIRVTVPDSQAERAMEIVEDFRASKQSVQEPTEIKQSTDKVTCPNCGSKNAEVSRDPRKFMSMLLGLAFMIPFVVRRRSWECRDCGAQWKSRFPRSR